jgi:glycosyltransferase involved in cell wall biosynthesis
MMQAQVCLIPMRVGLSIVDTYPLGVPLISTDHPGHGPEIDYLQHGTNGWLVQGRPGPAAYGQAVVELLKSPELLRQLREGCLVSARIYTMEAMVSNFARGILQALDSPPISHHL